MEFQHSPEGKARGTRPDPPASTGNIDANVQQMLGVLPFCPKSKCQARKGCRTPCSHIGRVGKSCTHNVAVTAWLVAKCQLAFQARPAASRAQQASVGAAPAATLLADVGTLKPAGRA